MGIRIRELKNITIRPEILMKALLDERSEEVYAEKKPKALCSPITPTLLKRVAPSKLTVSNIQYGTDSY